MKSRTFLAATAVILATASSPVFANEVRFGDIEVGITPCGKALEQLEGNIQKTFISAITEGRAAALGPNALGFDFVKDGYLICADDKVEAIQLTIPKEQSSEIADALAAKYKQTRRNLPHLGAGKAVFQSDSGSSSAELTYEHVSFDATLLLQSEKFQQTYNEYLAAKREAEKAKTKSAF